MKHKLGPATLWRRLRIKQLRSLDPRTVMIDVLLTTKDIAKMLGVQPSTVYTLVNRGLLTRGKDQRANLISLFRLLKERKLLDSLLAGSIVEPN